MRLLGENLVLFRTRRIFLVQRQCPHRGADLAYGRLEPDGLRCSFHGWKFDAERQVRRDAGGARGQPAVRAHQDGLSGRREERHPLRLSRRSGEPPAFPHFDCFVAPDAYTFAFKGYWDCNWLQALEVGIDPAHASWLHKYFEDEDTAGSYGKQFRGQPADCRRADQQGAARVRPARDPRRAHRIRHAPADLRQISDAQTHIRVTNILFPQAFVIPMNAEMTITQFHVPVDDTGCYWYSIFTSFAGAVDKDTMRSQRLRTYPAPDYKPIFSRQNGWGFSADEQKSQTFTGMGFDINIHDQFACESQGRIADRTKENLGSTDKGIVLYRRILLDAIRKKEARSRRWCSMAERGILRATDDRRHRSQRPPESTILEGLRREAPQENRLGMNKKEALKELESRRPEGSAFFVRRPARRAARQDARRLRKRRRRSRRASRSRAPCSSRTRRTAPSSRRSRRAAASACRRCKAPRTSLMVPDPATFRILPWAPETGWFLCDRKLQDGRPAPYCTRSAAEGRAAEVALRDDLRPRG